MNRNTLADFCVEPLEWSSARNTSNELENLSRPSLGGLEPPTFRLTAERANPLRHRDSTTPRPSTLSAGDKECLLLRRETVPVPKPRENAKMRTVNHTGPETGSRPGEDYTKHGYPRADNSGELLRLLPLPLMPFPPGPLILPPQERRLPLCALGTESQARAKGAAALPRGSSRGRWF